MSEYDEIVSFYNSNIENFKRSKENGIVQFIESYENHITHMTDSSKFRLVSAYHTMVYLYKGDKDENNNQNN